MKSWRKIIIPILAVMFVSTSAQAAIVDKIIAVVNDDIITLSDFNSGFEPFLKRIENNYKGDNKQQVIQQSADAFLQRLIDNLLIEQEARKPETAIVIKDEEVKDVIKDIVTKRKISQETLAKELAGQGMTLDGLKKEIRQQMIRGRLMRREIQAKIIVSDAEIGEYYNKHRDEYEGKEAVRIKQIIFPVSPKASAMEKARIKEQAQHVLELLEAKEEFEALAAKYSQGPAAAQGGDIGFIERGMVVEEVEEAAFKLLVGKTSGIIATDAGFHIIKVVDKRGAGLKSIDSVRQEIKNKLEEEKIEKKAEEWMVALRKKAHIEIRK